MPTAIVDTTVVATANLKSSNATPECIEAAIEELARLMNYGTLALDAGYLIFEEYMRYAELAGEPGVGDEFMKFVFDNMYNVERFVLVPLTESEDREFEEFPDDLALEKFDRSDRKFVGVALGCSPKGQIVVAGDRGWKNFRGALGKHGITINHLCE